MCLACFIKKSWNKKEKELQSPSKEEHGFYLNSLIAFPLFVVKFNARDPS